jgi:hypothetical protein
MKRTIITAIVAAVVIVFGAAAYAAADTAIVYGTGSGSSQTASDTVSVTASINPKLVLTVTTPAASQTVDFGNVVPGTAYGSQAVTLTVQSNKTYNVSSSVVGAAPLGLTTSLANSSNNPRTAGQGYTDNYNISVPWSTDPGNYTATVTYTVVQN